MGAVSSTPKKARCCADGVGEVRRVDLSDSRASHPVRPAVRMGRSHDRQGELSCLREEKPRLGRSPLPIRTAPGPPSRTGRALRVRGTGSRSTRSPEQAAAPFELRGAEAIVDEI